MPTRKLGDRLLFNAYSPPLWFNGLCVLQFSVPLDIEVSR